MDGQCFKNYGFKWEDNVSKFDAEFIINYDEDSNERYIFGVNV